MRMKGLPDNSLPDQSAFRRSLSDLLARNSCLRANQFVVVKELESLPGFLHRRSGQKNVRGSRYCGVFRTLSPLSLFGSRFTPGLT